MTTPTYIHLTHSDCHFNAENATMEFSLGDGRKVLMALEALEDMVAAAREVLSPRKSARRTGSGVSFVQTHPQVVEPVLLVALDPRDPHLRPSGSIHLTVGALQADVRTETGHIFPRAVLDSMVAQFAARKLPLFGCQLPERSHAWGPSSHLDIALVVKDMRVHEDVLLVTVAPVLGTDRGERLETALRMVHAVRSEAEERGVAPMVTATVYPVGRATVGGDGVVLEYSLSGFDLSIDGVPAVPAPVRSLGG